MLPRTNNTIAQTWTRRPYRVRLLTRLPKDGDIRRDVDSLPGCQRAVAFLDTQDGEIDLKWLTAPRVPHFAIQHGEGQHGKMPLCRSPTSVSWLSAVLEPCRRLGPSANRVYKKSCPPCPAHTASAFPHDHRPSLLPTYPYIVSEGR